MKLHRYSEDVNVSSRRLCLSIVNHGHGKLIEDLLNDLRSIDMSGCRIIVTNNIADASFDLSLFQDLPLTVIHNLRQHGFGANHNVAFTVSDSEFFVVVNPDIRIKSLDFKVLLEPFEEKSVAAVAPLVLSPDGGFEDSARRFPTVNRLAKRVLTRSRDLDYVIQEFPYEVDWVAGMFVVFRSEIFRQIGGFDSLRYYMYMEDADICRRLWLNNFKVLVTPSERVFHMAQRASRKNLKHMRWHLMSAFRYLTDL